ncbi:hypothetical protein LCGC14_1149630 [marine sediment metagenome]|uniref:Uncharacterized protein n=1 Tax=marine sediment metagenome TaxID=412755 RepID=A0A0F9LW00_9ZZZZ
MAKTDQPDQLTITDPEDVAWAEAAGKSLGQFLNEDARFQVIYDHLWDVIPPAGKFGETIGKAGKFIVTRKEKKPSLFEVMSNPLGGSVYYEIFRKKKWFCKEKLASFTLYLEGSPTISFFCTKKDWWLDFMKAANKKKNELSNT